MLYHNYIIKKKNIKAKMAIVLISMLNYTYTNILESSVKNKFNPKNTIGIEQLSSEDTHKVMDFSKGLGDISKGFFRPHAFNEISTKEALSRSNRINYSAKDKNNKYIAYFFLWDTQSDYPSLGIGIIDEYQNQQLGHALLDILIEDAKRLGATGIRLTCTKGNDRAFHLYQKKGFVYIGDMEPNTYNGKEIIEQSMQLDF